MDETWSFWPAMAVPITVKIPDPMTAPIPRDVRLSQPRVFFKRRSGSSESEINRSIFLTRNSPEPTRHPPHANLAEKLGHSTPQNYASQLLVQTRADKLKTQGERTGEGATPSSNWRSVRGVSWCRDRRSVPSVCGPRRRLRPR